MSTMRANARVALPVNEETKPTFLGLVANLIGHESRIKSMGANQVKPEWFLPSKDQEVEFAREVLQILYDFDMDEIAPTGKNILARLQHRKDAQERLQDLILAHKSDPEAVALHSHMLAHLYRKQRRLKVAEGIMAVFEEDFGEEENVFAEAMDILNTIAPIRRTDPIAVNDLIRQRLLVELPAAKRALMAGKVVGPTWPWPGLRELSPVLKKKNLYLFSAKPGHGKTTIALVLAKHFGHEQGFYVVVYAFETGADSLADRLLAAQLKMSSTDIFPPEKYDPTDPEWQKHFEEEAARWDKLQRTKGPIFFETCSGWGPAAYESSLAYHAARAEAMGKELIVINDYYSLLDGSSLPRAGREGGATSINNAISTWLKEMAEKYICYMINFAQDDNDMNYASRNNPYSGQQIFQRSQFYARLERLNEATDDNPSISAGKQTLDAFGDPMWYHREGQPDSRSLLHILKNNDGKKGYVKLAIANGFTHVVENQNSAPIAEWKERIYGKPRRGRKGGSRSHSNGDAKITEEFVGEE
jgi:DNA polymerase III delta prime subunit